VNKILCSAVLLTCAVAHAEILIEYRTDQWDDAGNIVFEGTGTRATDPPIARVQQTDFLFGLESSATTLIGLSDGQVRVEATDGSFTDISLSSVEHAFSSLTFNLRVDTEGAQAQVGEIFMTFDLVGGPDYMSGPLVLNRDGDNFYFIFSTNQLIERLTISTTLPVRDLRQLTVMGIDQLPQEGEGAEAPEPATGVLIAFAGLAAALASAGRRSIPHNVEQ
jgi:hypothetical protein